jgi:hypothetical protein
LIYLLTRPFAWLFALLLFIVTLPWKFATGIRDHRARKNTKVAAQAVKQQAKEAKQAAKPDGAAPPAEKPAEPTGNPAV